MTGTSDIERLRHRRTPIEMGGETFRALGYAMVDRIAEFLDTLPGRKVFPGKEPAEVRDALGCGSLPEMGTDPAALLARTADLMFENSLYNGHPRFWGYITSSAAPVGALGDLLAAAVNPNLGGWILSPMACEIELQTVRWVAELIGFPAGCGGILTSGGNMANFVGFWAGRRAKTGWDVRREGYAGRSERHRVYASRETHTWVQKAADLSGLGTDAIRWVETDASFRMDAAALRAAIESDREAGWIPLILIGTAGSVSTGAVDPLSELAVIAREHDMWFHVDGAYGAPAAVVPGVAPGFAGLDLADSVAVDPHKWLYAPIEAGCTLVRGPGHLRDTFGYRPAYYPPENPDDGAPVMFFELGPQNTRGFRALKVWLGLQQAGREGYAAMIADDIALARALYDFADADPRLEAVTHGLSVTTFRYVPEGVDPGTPGGERYLNELNQAIEESLQKEGEAYLTHAVLDDRFVLRACVVNFRTALADIEALPGIVKRHGAVLDRILRPGAPG